MSYDFAVWEGSPPLSDLHGASEFERRRSSLRSADGDLFPTAPIREFVTGLLAAYPDRDQPGVYDSPWIDAPLINNAVGGMIELRVIENRAEAVRKLIEVEATRLKLVAFDPQVGRLVPSATTMLRSAEFELPPSSEFGLHLHAVIGEAVTTAEAMVGVLEERATGFYVQWLADGDGLVLEVQSDESLPDGLRTGAEGAERLRRFGFDTDGGNWRLVIDDARPRLERVAGVVAAVVADVRRISPGAKMRIETFPVGHS